jgi:hypothetical protein
MSEITYLKGDATDPQARGVKLICHVCNDLGGWGKGFVLALSRRWEEPEQQYQAWHRNRNNNDFGLGAVQFVQVTPYVWVANMVAQRGIKRGNSGPPIREEKSVRKSVRNLFGSASSRNGIGFRASRGSVGNAFCRLVQRFGSGGGGPRPSGGGNGGGGPSPGGMGAGSILGRACDADEHARVGRHGELLIGARHAPYRRHPNHHFSTLRTKGVSRVRL